MIVPKNSSTPAHHPSGRESPAWESIPPRRRDQDVARDERRESTVANFPRVPFLSGRGRMRWCLVAVGGTSNVGKAARRSPRGASRLASLFRIRLSAGRPGLDGPDRSGCGGASVPAAFRETASVDPGERRAGWGDQLDRAIPCRSLGEDLSVMGSPRSSIGHDRRHHVVHQHERRRHDFGRGRVERRGGAVPGLAVGRQDRGLAASPALPPADVSRRGPGPRGWTLEQMHQKLAESQRRPDAVILYAGHNEFASR